MARFNSHGSGQYILMIFSFLQASERLSRRYSCDLCEYAATGENPQNSGHIYTPYTGTKEKENLSQDKKKCLQYHPFLKIYSSTPLNRKLHFFYAQLVLVLTEQSFQSNIIFFQRGKQWYGLIYPCDQCEYAAAKVNPLNKLHTGQVHTYI